MIMHNRAKSMHKIEVGGSRMALLPAACIENPIPPQGKNRVFVERLRAVLVVPGNCPKPPGR